VRIALFQPDIAGNVGTILRTAACLNVAVDLIEPMGFAWSERALARSAMDYAGHVRVVRHADWDAYLATVTGRIILMTTRGAERIDRFAFSPGDTLLLGAESSGVPDHVHDRADARVMIPLVAGMRSLNVAVTAAMTLGEALRQTREWPQ
jgi:tRNA (cytidine/uridine-2'-O-)-methyltransferase